MENFRKKIKVLFSYNTISGFTRLLLLMSIIVLTLFFYLFISQEVATTRGYILENFEQTLNIQRIMIGNWFQENADKIKMFSELNSTKDGNVTAIHNNIEVFLSNNPEFYSLSFVDVNGRTNNGTDVADREYFQQGLRGKSHITDVLYGRRSNEPLIIFSSPIFDYDGNVIGVLFGTVKLTTISQVMEQFQFGQTGVAYLVDRNGMLLTPMRPDDDAVAPINSSEPINVKETYGFKQAVQGGSGSAVYRGFRGQSVFGVFASIGHNWSIIAEINEAEILAPLYKKLFILGGLYFALLALLVYFITAFGRRIERPVSALMAMANKVENGDYGVVSKQEEYFLKAPQELQYLNQAFFSMVQQLIATIDQHNKVNSLLAKTESKFRSLVENSLVGVYVLLDCKFTYFNPKMEEMIGYSAEEMNGLDDLLKCVHIADREMVAARVHKRIDGEIEHDNYEMRLLHKNGTTIDVYVIAGTCSINGERAILGSMIDISDRKRFESTLEYYSYHDAITGLYNRAYFEGQIKQMAASDRNIGVVMCDVDKLKKINDSLGHHAGDELIKAAARAISFDDRRIITARIGGDEFALLVWDATQLRMDNLQKSIRARVSAYRSSPGALPLYVSLGCCLGEGFDVNKILRQADDNMYEEKNTNRETVREKINKYLESESGGITSYPD